MHTNDFDLLARELPLLIYPVSSLDDDPEVLITFAGFLPAPKSARGRAWRRARVTIDFFDLDVREELLRDRAFLVKATWVAYNNLNHADDLMRRDANQAIEQIAKPGFAHRNCARAFYDLCQVDPATARAYYKASIDYLDSLRGG